MPFNYEEYSQKCDTLSTEELQKEWEGYTRQIAGSSTSTATSVLCSPLTGGVSLIGLGLSAPRIHNARKKREIIEAKLRARGATHVTRTRDIAGSVALSGAVGGLTFGLLGPGTDIIATAAADGAGLAVDHTVGGAIKKSGLKDIEMKKMQEQMQMQQQYQAAYQQQFVNPGNIQMGGVMPPGLQHQPQPRMTLQDQMQMQQQYQAYEQQFVNLGNTQAGGFLPPGLQFQRQPETQQQLNIYQPAQHIGLQIGNQQQQWGTYQQGGDTSAQPGTNNYQQIPTDQSRYQPVGSGDLNPQQSVYHQQYAIVEGQLPKYQQVANASSTQDYQVTSQPYLTEKTPAYTTQVQEVDTSIPTQPGPTSKTEQAEGQNPSQIAVEPAAPTIEEELAFLRARLMQMELEKQTAASDTRTTESRENLGNQGLDLSRTSLMEPKVETGLTTRAPPEPENPTSTQAAGLGPPQHATLMAQSPQQQPQQLFQQNQQQSSLPASSLQFSPPPLTVANQVQYVNQTSLDQVRYQQQVNTPRYEAPLPQNPTYQAPQYIRQDSGYFSVASPVQQPAPLFQGYSQPHASYTVEQGQLYGRSASGIGSISNPTPHPMYSPSGVQSNFGEKGYPPPGGPGNQGNSMGNQQWVVQQPGMVQFAYGQPPPTSQPSMMGQQ